MYRKLTAFLAMAVIAVSAFASASPKQVEDALAANNFTEAKQMIAGVLAEHPSSARGHLLNAYVLAKADHNKQAANDELRMVEALDKKGDVKNSPLFGRTVAAVEALPAARVQAPVPAPVVVVPAPHYQTPAPVDSGGHGFLWFLIVVVFIAMIVMLIVRSLSRPTVVVQPSNSGGSYRSTGYGGTYTRSTPSPSYGSGYAAPVPAPAPVYTNSGGSSALGTGVAVAGGVVAGSLIADSLLHHHDHGYDSGSGRNWGGNNNGGGNGNYSPAGGVYPASTTESTEGESTEVRRDSFNSGSSSSTDWEPTPTPAPSRYSSSRDDDSSSSSSSSSWGDSSSSSDSSSGGSDW